jgi:hypothetical protein
MQSLPDEISPLSFPSQTHTLTNTSNQARVWPSVQQVTTPLKQQEQLTLTDYPESRQPESLVVSESAPLTKPVSYGHVVRDERRPHRPALDQPETSLLLPRAVRQPDCQG